MQLLVFGMELHFEASYGITLLICIHVEVPFWLVLLFASGANFEAVRDHDVRRLRDAQASALLLSPQVRLFVYIVNFSFDDTSHPLALL